MDHLSGRTALVTGASRGIGRATALALTQAGAQVIVHYSRGEKEATAVVTDIRNAGGKAEKVAADLRAADGPHRLAEQVRAVIGGRLDILVANAGISKSASIAETTVEDFDALFAVNVRAPYFLEQQLLPVMCKGSSVILLSPLAGRDFTLGMQALKRLATPEEIAAAITFLASDQAQWITGDTLRVDGGSKL